MASENAIYKCEQALISEKSDNIKRQLDLALEEKDTIEELWKSSLRELESVKEKLKDYQCGKQLIKSHNRLSDVQRDYSEAVRILESKISVLKTENNQLVAKNDFMKNELEQVTNQMAKITEQSLSVSNLLKEVTEKEQDWKSRYLLLEAQYIELDKSYQADKVKFAHVYKYERTESHLEGKLEVALQQRDELQSALERCHDRMSELMKTAACDRSKVEEAVQLVEEALQRQDEALAREASSKEEMKKMKTELNKLVEDAGQKVGDEVAGVRSQFQQLITTLREDLQLVKQERDRKVQEVHQWQQEYERLQDLKEKMTAPADLQQEDRCHKAYKKVQIIEAECLQLHLENEQLQLENKDLHKSLCQLQERYRKNCNAKVKLKQDLKQVQKQCQVCQHELAVTLERADLVSHQLHQTNLELTHLQSQAMFHMDSGQAKISVANTMELYKRLDDSYRQMNDKWKNEMKELTEKFEAKLKKLKRRNKQYSVPKESVISFE